MSTGFLVISVFSALFAAACVFAFAFGALSPGPFVLGYSLGAIFGLGLGAGGTFLDQWETRLSSVLGVRLARRSQDYLYRFAMGLLFISLFLQISEVSKGASQVLHYALLFFIALAVPVSSWIGCYWAYQRRFEQ
ncbi:MAG: hypothetical protein AAFN79_16470 [Pseudomonadota bacterium]